MSTGKGGGGKGLPEKESESGAAYSIGLLALRTQPGLGVVGGGRRGDGRIHPHPRRMRRQNWCGG